MERAAGWDRLGCALGLLGGVLLQPAAAQEGASVQFEFSQLRSDRGSVMCALYAGPKEFLSQSLRQRMTPIQGGRAVCVFRDLPPGAYAMAAYHDENANLKLDTNLFGIPKEGLAASNNARGTMGPPRWKDASFSYPGGTLRQQLRIRY